MQEGAMAGFALSPHEVGRLGEELGARYARDLGIDVIETNWRCSAGEVDIVASDGGTCVFIEVKTRLDPSGATVFPEEAIDAAKLERYRRLAKAYQLCHPQLGSIRLDAAGVTLIAPGHAHMHYVKGVWLDEP